MACLASTTSSRGFWPPCTIPMEAASSSVIPTKLCVLDTLTPAKRHRAQQLTGSKNIGVPATLARNCILGSYPSGQLDGPSLSCGPPWNGRSSFGGSMRQLVRLPSGRPYSRAVRKQRSLHCTEQQGFPGTSSLFPGFEGNSRNLILSVDGGFEGSGSWPQFSSW